jgi:hypothetical protein
MSRWLPLPGIALVIAGASSSWAVPDGHRPPPSDLARNKLHGSVETMTSEIAERDGAGDEWGPSTHRQVFTFDRRGALVAHEATNPDGSTVRWERRYDAEGRPSETRSYYNGAFTSGTRTSYDDRGRVARTTYVDRDGTERESSSITYDVHGRATKREQLSLRSGEPGTYLVEAVEQGIGVSGASVATTVMDEQGRVAEVQLAGEDGRPLYRQVMIRDRDGRLVRQEWRLESADALIRGQEAPPMPDAEREKLADVMSHALGPDQSFTSTTFAYDAAGRLVEKHTRMGVLSDERTTFLYDDRGNPVERTTVDESRELRVEDDGATEEMNEQRREQRTRFEYRYDEHGNWTERVTWGSAQPDGELVRQSVERRRFTYY